MKITVTFDSLEEFQKACIIGQKEKPLFDEPHTAEEISKALDEIKEEEKKPEKKTEKKEVEKLPFGEPDEEPEAEKPKAIKAEDVRAVLNDVVKAKGREAVKDLFKSFGAANFTKVKPEDYEALLKAAEEVLND